MGEIKKQREGNRRANPVSRAEVLIKIETAKIAKISYHDNFPDADLPNCFNASSTRAKNLCVVVFLGLAKDSLPFDLMKSFTIRDQFCPNSMSSNIMNKINSMG